MSALRILHVGSGFRPWRRGGLVAYVEDLMDEQVRRGHDVAYLFAGRQYPLGRGPRLKRWRRGPIPMLEIVDSPLFDHGRQPELELDEPRVESLVDEALTAWRPDVVHVQELAGLPSSILELAGRHAPVVYTLQDYYGLCPTFKLLDSTGAVCLRREIGADCVATVAAEPRDPLLLVHATVGFEVRRRLRRLPEARRERIAVRAAERVTELGRGRRSRPEPRDPLAFQRRRDVNVARTGAVARVVAMSRRVAEIHELLGVDPAHIEVQRLTLAHIERLTPRRPSPGAPVTFATLGGGESAAKGAGVLLGAARALAADPPAAPYRILLFGHPAPEVAAAARATPGVEVRGSYRAAELDRLLDEVDVGIVPSVWEEAWGYAGIEFLAKAIPVIGNAIGGIPEYVEEGRSGWLNHSCSAAGLAAIMRAAVESPESVARLNERLIAERDAIVPSFAGHADEMDRVYREVVAGRALG